jgi:transcriptional regulator
MYLRADHAETDVGALKTFVQENSLGIITTALQSTNFPLLQCTHIPWVYDVTEDGLGVLRGHMARNNPHAKALIEASSRSSESTLDTEVMVLFNAPHDSYVTPKYYVETKPTTGKVVPTWNYAAAQIYGKATIYPSDVNFIMKQVDDLTQQQESRGESRTTPWKVTDAPSKYVDILLKAIIGIQIEVTRLEGKFKMSQEMGEKDRQGVVDGFRAMKSEKGEALAQLVKERGILREQAKARSK